MRLSQSFTTRIANVFQHTKRVKVPYQIFSPVSIPNHSNVRKHLFSFPLKSGILLMPTLIEMSNSRDYRSLLIERKLRVNWKREHFAAGCLGIWKIAFTVAQICKCRFNVERTWVVNLRGNSPFAQIFL